MYREKCSGKQKYKKKQKQSATIFERVVALFYSTCFEHCNLHSRSPPCTDLILNTKDQIGGKHMEGRHPKRRKDKYNPYQIYEKDTKQEKPLSTDGGFSFAGSIQEVIKFRE